MLLPDYYLKFQFNILLTATITKFLNTTKLAELKDPNNTGAKVKNQSHDICKRFVYNALPVSEHYKNNNFQGGKYPVT
jgi:hypothetical protein